MVLSGAGKNFCAGIDLPSLMAEFQQQQQEPPGGGAACPGRQRYHFRQFVFVLQDAMSAFERCQVPVIAAVHGHCVGAGIDLITACDIRLATSDATLCVKVRAGARRAHALPACPPATVRVFLLENANKTKQCCCLPAFCWREQHNAASLLAWSGLHQYFAAAPLLLLPCRRQTWQLWRTWAPCSDSPALWGTALQLSWR